MTSDREQGDYLRRLPAGHYRGLAYIHWTMTIEDRRKGWLKPIVYYKLRELLTHTMFRYGLVCPIFCCMPDHFHFFWIGVSEKSDQLKAARFFRQRMNQVLEAIGYRLQSQGFDSVLGEEDREREAVETLVEYIARNPERAKLVPVDGFKSYPYTSCLVPGYPELRLFEPDYWTRFWRTYSYLRQTGLFGEVSE